MIHAYRHILDIDLSALQFNGLTWKACTALTNLQSNY